MAVHPATGIDPLIRKLDGATDLIDDEILSLRSLPMQVVDIKAGQDIVRQGDRPLRCCLLLHGVACSYQVTGGGKRQILAFQVPGDILDLQSLHLTVLDNGVSTLTPCRVGFIQHEALLDLFSRHARLQRAFWRETLVGAAIHRAWITNVGRRDGASRAAHILCDMIVRLRAAGLCDGRSCDLPITQGELADALGLTKVHVNRVLRDLRRKGLVRFKDAVLTILDWDRLKEAGDFEPTYLHLPDRTPAVARPAGGQAAA